MSVTTYVTPFCSGCCGNTITPPRHLRLLVNVGLVESMVHAVRGAPLPLKVSAPAVVEVLAPTSMKRGSPVYPGQASCGLGVSLPLNEVSGSVDPLPGKKTGYDPGAVRPWFTSNAAAICQDEYPVARYDPKPVCVSLGSIIAIA